MKRCAVCKEEVTKGNGTYRYGRLIHRRCVESAELIRYKLLAEKYGRRRW